MSFGTTDQTAYTRYPNHTSIKCHSCDADLIGHTTDHGFPDGRGRFAKYCCECRMHTFYDGPLSMAEHRIKPDAPFVQMPKPAPLPEPEWARTIRKPSHGTYMVRVLIVVWCVAALYVYAVN